MIPKLLASLLVTMLIAGVCLAAEKPVSDDVISDQVMIKLTSDAVVKGGALKADVKEGVVTLSGTVSGQPQKDRAGKLAGKVKGVKRVVNNIAVSKTPK